MAGVMTGGQPTSGMQNRGRLIFAIWGTVSAFVIAAASAATWLTIRTERSAISETQERVLRFVSGAEAALNRALIGIDLQLADMGSLLAPVTSPEGEIDRGAAERVLRGEVRRNLEFRDLAAIEEGGHVLAAAREQTERLGVPVSNLNAKYYT